MPQTGIPGRGFVIKPQLTRPIDCCITFPELTNHIAHVRNAFAGPVLMGDQLSGGLEAHMHAASISA